jgi:hypothetical protein
VDNPCQIHTAIHLPETRLIRREVTGKYAIKIVISTHVCGTRIEREVEIYATNVAKKTKCMSTNAEKWEKNPVSETSCILISRIPDDEKTQKSQ